jgi:HlyD family secretion protein
MKRLLKHGKFFAVAVLFVGLMLMAFWPEPAAVDLVRAEKGTLTVTIDEEGETRVRERFVVSAPVAGRVQRIDLEPGDSVVRGQTVVASFSPADPAPLDARSRAEAEAAVKAAEAAIGRVRAERDRAAAVERLARSELGRTRALVEKQVAARQTLESAESQASAAGEALRAADFAVASAEHELAVARARLLSGSGDAGAARAPIALRAPIDGVVLKRLRESEAIVLPGEPLLELGDPRRLEIVVDFLSTDAVRIHAGDPVHIERWGGEGALRGRVRRIEPSGFLKVSALGVEEQRVNVIIDFEDAFEAWKRLGDGYRVEVRVVVWHAESVLKVPTSSLFRRGESWAVFAAENGRARLRLVEVGQLNGTDAQVLAGLSEGEVIIIHPSDTLQDGGRIKAR